MRLFNISGNAVRYIICETSDALKGNLIIFSVDAGLIHIILKVDGASHGQQLSIVISRQFFAIYQAIWLIKMLIRQKKFHVVLNGN